MMHKYDARSVWFSAQQVFEPDQLTRIDGSADLAFDQRIQNDTSILADLERIVIWLDARWCFSEQALTKRSPQVMIPNSKIARKRHSVCETLEMIIGSRIVIADQITSKDHKGRPGIELTHLFDETAEACIRPDSIILCLGIGHDMGI